MKSTIIAAISICLASAGFSAAQSPAKTPKPVDQDTNGEQRVRGKRGHGRHHRKHRHHSRMMAKMFERADTDKDGMLSRGEMRSAADRRFARLDSDKNGFVTKREAKEARDAFRAEMKAKHAEMKTKGNRRTGPRRRHHKRTKK